ATNGGDRDPHSVRIGRIGEDSMQAQARASWFPAFACGMSCQGCILFPIEATICTHPEAGGIDSGVEDIGFCGASRLNHPDCVQFLSALLRELESMFWLKPCLAKVIAVAQE